MNLMLELFFVSMFIGGLVLVIKVCGPLFKNRYAISLKQILWVILALRLLLPFSYGGTLFTITTREYDNGAKVYSAQGITDDEVAPESVFVTLPDHVTREEALDNGWRASDKEVTYSPRVAMIKEEKLDEYSTQTGFMKEETLSEYIQYGIFQVMSFMEYYLKEIVMIYLVGVAVFFLYHGVARVFFGLKRKKKRKLVENQRIIEIFRETAKKIGVKRLPILYSMQGLVSPMATGFFRFQVYIPDIDLYQQEEELATIFAHELTHIYHQDLRIKMLYLLANGFHWFNPLVYLMVQQASKDMELYCDKSVVEMYNWEERQAYNRQLLSILKNHTKKSRQEFTTTCFRGGVKEMKERFLNNLDMRVKRQGVFPFLMAGVFIVVSAGIFSINVKAEKLYFENGYWSYSMRLLDEGSYWKGMESDLESDCSGDASYMRPYRMGDPALEMEPKKMENGNYRIPQRLNNLEGNVDVYFFEIEPSGNSLKEPPQVDIYCGKKKIENYEVIADGWDNGTAAVEKEPEFFKEQCKKGEENPLFEVKSWVYPEIEKVRLFFPQGQEPDVIDVQDTVLNDDGTIRYEGEPGEVIYRGGNIDETISTGEFWLGEHYAIETYDYVYDLRDVAPPFYRGFRIKCYWVHEDGIQSCTYYMVLRTQVMEYF